MKINNIRPSTSNGALAKSIALLLLLCLAINPLFAQEAQPVDVEAFWLWKFLGRLHPMIVHFPISLIIVALLLEFIQRMSGKRSMSDAIRALIYVGSASAVLAVVFGLLLSNTDDYGGDLLPIHQWSGIATMILSVLMAIAASQNLQKVQFILLIITVMFVGFAGHYGAMLTHGDDYLTGAFPSEEQKNINGNKADVLAVKDGQLSEENIQELNVEVRTIFAHHCYKCHGKAKVKGELRLDSREAIMKGGEDGVVVVPEHPEKSEMIRRVSLSANHKDVMPEKGKKLSEREIAVLEFWIKNGAPWPSGPEKSIYRVAALEPRMPAIPEGPDDMINPIDHFVDDYFRKNDVEWSDPVNDHIFLRRIYLDVIGLLPPPDSIDAFIKDSDPGKREIMVKRLLARNDDYAQQWLTFWNDALRNDYTGTGYITGGRFDITKWLYATLKNNKPYDSFVKELISPNKESKGFIEGIKWRGTINASQRTEMQAAQNVSQVFLGLNIKCASCHDSFISDWKLDDAYAFANIFSDTTLEINRCDKPTGKVAGRRLLFKELGEINTEAVTDERLKQLADFLVQPKDGRLYRTLVNRVWAQLMGRGIVEPVDVMDNEPWSQDLLDWLASDFVADGRDIKKLLFKILTSRTYQLPSVGFKEEALIGAPDYVFGGMLRRRLTAEQFTDAVSAAIEPVYPDSVIVYNLLPAYAKKSIPFARAALVKNDPYLTALGRPTRETVSTSRSSQANLLQALELTNGTRFNEAIQRGAESWKTKYPDVTTLVREVYRNTLGRLPATEEEAIALKSLGQTPSGNAIQDFIWAMTLHPEFQLIY
ncbi:MAG TPA: DUF1549 domain-containing protein [Chryseolinea sp.]|nr:DUF1549 domain-containing protein [Chryseolinea sp.]